MAACRVEAAMDLLAMVRGHAASQDPPTCRAVAPYTAIFEHTVVGIAVEVRAPVCAEHDQFLSHADGYKRSIKLREST